MAISLEDLKKKAREDRRDLEELEAAIRVMERLDGITVASEPKTTPATTTPLASTGAIDLNDLALPTKAKKKRSTLADDINDVISRIGDQEFTVTHIYAALKQMGKASDAKHYKNRISVTVRMLSVDGVITRTHKGKGNDPHRYKVASKDADKEKGSRANDSHLSTVAAKAHN